MIVKQLPQADYTEIWNDMKAFTTAREPHTPDELWLLEHKPVYTQGLAGKPEHVLHLGNIPLVHSDRGGQVTYHGPGQLMIYTLFNLNRLNLNTRCFVAALENTIIALLKDYDITAYGKRDAPGVYVNEAKIASIGLRVRRHYAYHGIALNVNMDLQPFKNINPCGFKSLAMTQIADFVPRITLSEINNGVIKQFKQWHQPSQGAPFNPKSCT